MLLVPDNIYVELFFSFMSAESHAEVYKRKGIESDTYLPCVPNIYNPRNYDRRPEIQLSNLPSSGCPCRRYQNIPIQNYPVLTERENEKLAEYKNCFEEPVHDIQIEMNPEVVRNQYILKNSVVDEQNDRLKCMRLCPQGCPNSQQICRKYPQICRQYPRICRKYPQSDSSYPSKLKEESEEETEECCTCQDDDNVIPDLICRVTKNFVNKVSKAMQCRQHRQRKTSQ